MRAIIAAIVLCLTACAAPPDAPTIESGMPQPTIVADPAQACAADGGAWRPVCRRGLPMCIKPYKDAGKVCSDGDDCEGHCLVDTGASGVNLTGQCQADNQPCGCFTYLTKGKPTTICVD